MPIGIDRQLQAIPYGQLVVDRRQVMAHGGFADAQPVSDGLVPTPLADQGDNLPLASGERLYFDFFWIEGLAGRRTARQLAQHTGDEQVLQPDLAGGDPSDGFEEDFGGALLEH